METAVSEGVLPTVSFVPLSDVVPARRQIDLAEVPALVLPQWAVAEAGADPAVPGELPGAPHAAGPLPLARSDPADPRELHLTPSFRAEAAKFMISYFEI